MSAEVFLQAILADPDDDAPRLVYADWLEDSDPARAEFIRVQCRLADSKEALSRSAVDDPLPAGALIFSKRTPLESREWHLLYENAPKWLGGAPGEWPVGHPGGRVNVSTGGGAPVTYQFRRGFIGHVTSPADVWLRHGDAILAAHPVTEVTLTTWPNLTILCGIQFTTAGPVDYQFLKHRFSLPANTPASEIVRHAFGLAWPRIRKWNLPGATQ